MAESQGRFTDEAYIVRAMNKGGSPKDAHYECYIVKDDQDPAEALDRANKAGGWLRKNKGYDVIFVYHSFLMRWDKEAQQMVDSEVLTG